MKVRYSPIRDYAIIGDCHGAALVSRSGSVDWCCLERFDAEPIFCRLLDADQGGCFSIAPAGGFHATRSYAPQTALLRTTFSCREGRVRLTDFMPVGRAPGAGTHDYVNLKAPFWLVRIVEGLEGAVPVAVHYQPTHAWTKRDIRLRSERDGVIASENGPWLAGQAEWTLSGNCAKAQLDVQANQRYVFVVAARPLSVAMLERVPRLLKIAQAFWSEWLGYCRYRGPYREAVVRSVLTLKLLTYAPTGAIVAAPTTSLPEQIGGERNWDYRYCWLRDGTFMLYALAALGYSGEARRFSEFLQRSCTATHPKVQIMYGVDGRADLPEQSMEHLEGYRGSRPVRIGNAAHRQHQLDVYGEVLSWAHLYRRLSRPLKPEQRRFLEDLAGHVGRQWREPEQGLWEMRTEPRHHVFGKIMSWVALDRAMDLFGAKKPWFTEREAIRREIEQHGIDPRDKHLVQAFGTSEVDAALLHAPFFGYPVDRPVFEKTIEAVERTLQHNDFVHRYRADDGLPPGEGAFLICSFWMVDALLLADQGRKAHELFERLLAYANDVGLYAEAIDPESKEFLGNFPQAFTHLALIESAINLWLYDRHGAQALRGTHADRARFGVEATDGPKALWASLKKSGRLLRLLSSRRSILSEEVLR